MIRRLVSIDFWSDDKVVNMSPEDKYFMLYLLTNPHTTQLGIYKLNTKYAAFEMGYDEKTVIALLNRFENFHNIIYYSDKTGEVAIRKYLIHSIIKGGKPVSDLLWKEINDVKDEELIIRVFSEIKNSKHINDTVRNVVNKYLEKPDAENPPMENRPVEALQGNTFATPLQQIETKCNTEKEKELEKELELEKEREKEACHTITPVSRFEEFWNNYPKKVHRNKAECAYVDSVLDNIKEEWLVEAAKEYALCMQITEDRYIKNPENWLSGNDYLDYPPGTYEKQREREQNRKQKIEEDYKPNYQPKKEPYDPMKSKYAHIYTNMNM